MFYIFSESFIFILIIISFTKLVMWLTDWPMWHMTCYLNGLLELTWLLKLIATLIPTWSFHSRLTSKRNPYSLNWTIPISYATTLLSNDERIIPKSLSFSVILIYLNAKNYLLMLVESLRTLFSAPFWI